MAHLAFLYARDLSVKVGYPVLQPHYFPVLQDKYVTFHNSDKCASKSFSYWEDVLKILKPEFEKRDIKIFQIGEGPDKKINGVDEFYNFTSFKQSAYLIQNSQAHFGIDSAPIHIASALNKPTVSIYAHTYASTCDPLWNKGKALIIESDRGGKKPSFSNHETPKEIDRIKPEQIAESVFKMLNIGNYTSQKTIFIGDKYKSKIVDIIPSSMPSNISVDDAEIRIRMDIHFDENVLVQILQGVGRQVEIITNTHLNENLVESFKPKISKITYNAERFNADFLKYLKHSGLNFELNCTKEKNLSEERMKFFNYEIVLCDKKESAKKLKEKYKDLKHSFKFYSGRFYVRGDETFASLCKNTDDIQFWNDAKYFRVYETVTV